MGHTPDCLSYNRFGDGFDCICTEASGEPPPAKKLVPLGPRDGLGDLLTRAESLTPQKATWLYWFRTACNAAMKSLCLKSKCGAVIVGRSEFEASPELAPLFEGSVLSVGFNSPPRHDPANRRCGQTTPSRAHPKAGRTCCVHAEVRALLAAPRHRLVGATIYFSRVDENGYLLPSGRPWCTECSKLALDLGVGHWVLWHEDGPQTYEAAHYDWLSNRYDPQPDASEVDQHAHEASP